MRKIMTVAIMWILVPMLFAVDVTVVEKATKIYVLKASSSQPLEKLNEEYLDIIARSHDYNNSIANITGFRQIDTLQIDDGSLTGWGANGEATWKEAVQLPVLEDMSIIGLL